MVARTKKREDLTLRDLLSRLTYVQACKLLGPNARELIQQGGKVEIVIDEQVFLGSDLFRLTLLDATVTITVMAEARQRLRFNCNRCSKFCDHIGAAVSLILEEKLALGLAAPPPERVPVESLSDEELIAQATRERQERAVSEKMILKSGNGGGPWSDYTITNPLSGRTYRVALRGTELGESFCSCPDFRKNTLGTCKHILNALEKIKRRFSADERKRPYRQKGIAVHLRYGAELELRLLSPRLRDEEVKKIVRPLQDRAITDVHDLLSRLRRLEAAGRDVLIYPDAEEYIDSYLFRERMDAKVKEIRKNPRAHPLRKTLLECELLPYQLDGIAFAAGAGRAILADDMGLGKTIQGIGVSELLAREVGIGRVLIVCPASLKAQWRSEVRRFSKRDCQLVLGSAATRGQQYENDCFFTVCNYEQVLRDILHIERVKWDLIVLDEGQRIKNWEAKTSRIIKGLRSRFALVLSGTPLENRLDELFSVVEFIDDRRLGPAFRFYNRHRVADERGKVLGYKNLGELRKRLQPIMLRRTRNSVMKELPERTTEIVRITPTDEQLELHGGWIRIVSTIVRKPYISEMDLLRLQKALLMCRMTADSTFLINKEEPAYSSKLEKLDELLGQLAAEDDRKIVLFSEWTTMLNLVETILSKHGMRFVRLDGKVPQKTRQQLVHEFQNDPDCTVFITTNAGSTGLNLQSANTVINVDLPWNPAVLEQRIGRAHRMGQTNPVHVFVLVTEETIEENLLATLGAKHELFLATLDPNSDVDELDLSSGIEELKSRLELLLGAKPEAPLDESQKARSEDDLRRLEHGERIAAAGGQLLGSAFAFLNELFPSDEGTEESKQVADLLKKRFAEGTTVDDHGRPKLEITLPDRSALDKLAESLAQWLTSEQPPSTQA